MKPNMCLKHNHTAKLFFEKVTLPTVTRWLFLQSGSCQSDRTRQTSVRTSVIISKYMHIPTDAYPCSSMTYFSVIHLYFFWKGWRGSGATCVVFPSEPPAFSPVFFFNVLCYRRLKSPRRHTYQFFNFVVINVYQCFLLLMLWVLYNVISEVWSALSIESWTGWQLGVR